MSSKQISTDLRKLIINERTKLVPYRTIAKKYGISIGAVQHIWKKFTEKGMVTDLPGRGRKRATSFREDHRIVRMVKQNPKLSSRNIKESLGLNVSTRTVCRRLKESGLKNCAASKRPYISKTNKAKRLEFAKKYIEKDLEFWKQVLWSDESKFELFGQKRRQRVWRKPNEALKEANVQKTVKHGGGNIMVWGSFAWSGVGSLVRIEGIMKATDYINILRTHLEVSLQKTSLEDSFLFQQDNDPKHTAKVTSAFFKQNQIQLLDWPPQSPDLNPIENLWGYLDDKVDKTNVSSKESYFDALKDAWEKINPNFLKKLVESMPRRLQAVINAKGGHTKY